MGSDRMELIARLGAAQQAAEGDLNVLLRDALAALVEDHGVIAATERRRATDRKRKRRDGSMDSTDSAEPTECAEVRAPLPPSPPLSSPTPLINPSSPPIPASSAAAPVAGTPEAEAEARLLARFDDPADRAGVERFLGYAVDTVKRIAWGGRLGALLDRPPHFTPGELAEGLEALLTQDVGTWGPALLKRWVARVRTDAARAVLAEAEAKTGVASRGGMPGADAMAAWEYVSGDLLRKQVQRTVTMDDLGALGPRSRTALRAVGGLPALSQLDQRQLPFARRDFLAAFKASTPSEVPASC